MYLKFLLILLSIKKINGSLDLFKMSTFKIFAEGLAYKIDTEFKLTTNVSSEFEAGISNWNQADFFWDIQKLLEDTKLRCAGLSGHVSQWDDFHELLVKHIPKRKGTEGILNDLHTKAYIFYSTIVYFLQELPSLMTNSQNLGFSQFCDGFQLIKDNNLIFGPEGEYKNHTKDLTGYFEEIFKVWKAPERKKLCGKIPSPRVGLFRYFKVILSIHLRRFLISYFGNAVCTRITVKKETKILEQFLSESQAYTALMETALKNLNHYVLDCPPKIEERDQEALKIQLEGLITTKIISENSLSNSTKPCKYNCDLQSIGSSLKKNECSKFLECRYISTRYDVCLLRNNSRTYEWIKDNEGNIYGKSQYSRAHNVCQGTTVTLNREYTWYNGYFCDYCVCTCVGKPRWSSKVIIAISFRDQLSDVKNNWVVVGARFVKKDFMIHVQIKEGQLLPYGGINSTRWRNLEAFDYSEENDRFYLVSSSADYKNKVMIPGRDYGPAEKINLDDLVAPLGYLITGVRFKFAWDLRNWPVLRRGITQLEIQATKFDFLKGKLFEKSFWVPASLMPKEYLELENPDDPSKAPPEELQEITSGKTVEFRASDFEKDAGQSTVPFFDGRNLEFSPPAPLQGLGVFHRGHQGFGGYLAFRALDLNMYTIFSDY
ncbi:hypothetical protein G9C98_000716 [Cotesia typhae]|uniref:Uncharacterized protein n=1 Tax=Cotesia typhae TaxID=2053667 RepID=A0A8J5RFC8_9HYME|nr:hypothetical protein G9C98_000716 [Cotesia typhae]